MLKKTFCLLTLGGYGRCRYMILQNATCTCYRVLHGAIRWPKMLHVAKWYHIVLHGATPCYTELYDAAQCYIVFVVLLYKISILLCKQLFEWYSVFLNSVNLKCFKVFYFSLRFY